MCGVSTSFLTRPIPPSGGGGTGEKEVWARRSSGRFISRGPSNPGHPTPSTGFRREDMPAFAAAASSQNGGKRSKSWGVGWLNPCQPPLAIMPRLISPRKLTLGSRLDVKLLWIEMIRRVGSATARFAKPLRAQTYNIARQGQERGGRVQNLLAAL